MRLLKVIIISGCLCLAACSGNRTTTKPVDYVEVDNPYITMTKDAPDKIWVPRSSVEQGPPRATEAVKQGYDKFFTPKTTPPLPPSPQPSPPSPRQAVAAASLQQPASYAPVPPGPIQLKHRMVVLEIGQNGLLQPLNEKLHRSGTVLLADPSQAMSLAQSAQLGSPEGKSGFAARLQQEYNVNEVVFVTASGIASGKPVTVEVYDSMGGVLLRGVDVVVPAFKENDQAARDAAVAETVAGIAIKLQELVPFLPWYSRISAVNGNRAYVTAGKESGLRIGQTLKVYRGGKQMKGLGFAPGSRVGTLEVEGFVGPNAAFCAMKDGQGVETSDVVSAD